MTTFRSWAAMALVIATSALALQIADAQAQGVGFSQATAQISADAPATFFADPEQIAAHLRAEGYATQISTDAEGDPLISTRAQGTRYSIYFYGCSGGTNCTSITFDSAFQPTKKSSLEHLNEWNLNKRYAYAVVRKDKAVAIRMDVQMIGGLSHETFKETVSLWDRQLGAFLRHIEF